MNKNTPSVQTLLQNYFLRRLKNQRNVSVETIHSYRDTFRIYLAFIKEIHNVNPTELTIHHFEISYLEDFCKYLKDTRKNKPITINNRIAAIKSFMHYVSETEPEYSDITRKAILLPMQKYERQVMTFISKDEFDIMLSKCNTNTFIGSRDKLMLLLLYNTGMRVSELLSITYDDFQSAHDSKSKNLLIHGKGRKQRIIPLWKNTSSYVDKYIQTFPSNDGKTLFINKNGAPLTRSGVRTRIATIVEMTLDECPELKGKEISPHTFRHSVAMNMLIAGVDISTIAIWLGHESIETTHKYMVADIELKRKAMEKVGVLGNDTYTYKPSADIVSFLESL